MCCQKVVASTLNDCLAWQTIWPVPAQVCRGLMGKAVQDPREAGDWLQRTLRQQASPVSACYIVAWQAGHNLREAACSP